jgi:hypothetical protein
MRLIRNAGGGYSLLEISDSDLAGIQYGLVATDQPHLIDEALREQRLARQRWLARPTDLHYRGQLAEIGPRAADAMEQELIRRSHS